MRLESDRIRQSLAYTTEFSRRTKDEMRCTIDSADSIGGTAERGGWQN